MVDPLPTLLVGASASAGTHALSTALATAINDGLVTMAVSGRQVLLPVWHGVSKDQAVSYGPSPADKVALHAAESTIDQIADEISVVAVPE